MKKIDYTFDDYRLFNKMLKDIREYTQSNFIIIDKKLESRLITKYSSESYDIFKKMLEIYSGEKKEDKKIYELEYLGKDSMFGELWSKFRMRERAIEILDYSLYKKLFLEYYPSFRKGKFYGKIVSQKNNITEYELEFNLNEPLLKKFKKIWLHYTVNEKEKKLF